MRNVFITGGTGYIGRRLIERLLQRGHGVTALVRTGSEAKVPNGANVITADPFAAETFQSAVLAGSVFVQLLGVAHPSPKKSRQFREIDLRSVKASADAAAAGGVSHFVYVSVNAVPSKIMQAYQAVRKEGEAYCQAKGLPCTFIRPWYVVGPGHWWPLLFLPLYGIAQIVPAWKKAAAPRTLVTIAQMINTLISAVESDPESLRIIEIPQIRAASLR